MPNKSKQYSCRTRHFAWCSPSSVPYVSTIGGLLGEATKLSIPTALPNHGLFRRIRKYGGNWRATFLSMVGVLTWLLFYAAWTFEIVLALCLCSLHVFQMSEITILVPKYLVLERQCMLCTYKSLFGLHCSVMCVFRLEDGSPMIMIIPAGRLCEFAYFISSSLLFIMKQPAGASKISAGDSCWIPSPRSGNSHRQPSHSNHFDHLCHASFFWYIFGHVCTG